LAAAVPILTDLRNPSVAWVQGLRCDKATVNAKPLTGIVTKGVNA